MRLSSIFCSRGHLDSDHRNEYSVAKGGEGQADSVKGKLWQRWRKQICIYKTGKPADRWETWDCEMASGHWNLWLSWVVSGHSDSEGQVEGGLDGDLTAGASGSFITFWAESWRSYLSTRCWSCSGDLLHFFLFLSLIQEISVFFITFSVRRMGMGRIWKSPGRCYTWRQRASNPSFPPIIKRNCRMWG